RSAISGSNRSRSLRISIVIGNLIPAEQLDGDLNEVKKALEKHTVHDMEVDGDASFVPVGLTAAAMRREIPVPAI
ncbi:hypothetical protein ACC691_40130, partial [Rhizobium johnstonii]